MLTLVTVGGVDESTRLQINNILQKTNIQELETIIPQEAVFESRRNQVSLTDLSVCVAHSKHSQILIDVSNHAIQSMEEVNLIMYYTHL